MFHGVILTEAPFFAGISEVSIFGQADDRVFEALALDTPVWTQAVQLGKGAFAQVPTVNLGHWGRDYLTLLDRAEADHLFCRLPRLLADLTKRILAG